ncbi:hypothetical protein [Xylocopilactobacillus apicola]|uniref:WxL domain-containing protein n=1 Tax=Xylocopilactobacillus apicola TaxID=2932184 RepID=A0AAU9CZP3_9LACO|nr:hypothetical protein [Xylocopilactobacillus apicola]BDR57891.1 hypothetical protein XA3_03320 [Xylocopilactobacillus apicola]
MKEKKKTLKIALSCASILGLFAPTVVGQHELVKADTVVASATTNVGITFEDGNLSLVSVPNFDFGANTLDGKTRFVPLYSNAANRVDDVTNGAFVDTATTTTGNVTVSTKKLRNPANYRALIVTDSRLPINNSGTYNGWKVSAHLDVGSASSLVGSNWNSHPTGTNPDPNPDAGMNAGTNLKFAAAIEFGNGYNGTGYKIDSLTDGQTGNSAAISHPATYYNSDPEMLGTENNNGVVSPTPASVWKRVDSASDDVPADNQVSGDFKGLFFPRLSKTPSKNTASQLTAVSSTGPNSANNANNASITTIPMSTVDNDIWGYTKGQESIANGGIASGSGPESVSNGAWALDFYDQGSAIMALPSAVTLNRPGTYIYNLYWTLSTGFQENP